jgi:hypothetical protein
VKKKEIYHEPDIKPDINLMRFHNRLEVIRYVLDKSIASESWVEKVDLYNKARMMMENICKKEEIFRGE